jgi:DNA-damage-inducible protein J
MYLKRGIMAATEMVHVRIEKRIKTQAAKTLAAMGLSVSDAVRVLLTRVAAEKALPFEVKVPNAATAAAMREARKGGLRPFKNVPELMSNLNAEDSVDPKLFGQILRAGQTLDQAARKGKLHSFHEAFGKE